MKNSKICTKCGNDLPLKLFPIINKKTGKISSMCITCKRQYERDYWGRVKLDKRIIKNKLSKNNRIKKRKYIIELLKNSKCVDCGIDDWRVLEFDHRNRKTKKFNIADSVSFSIEKIQKEIDKCDIVCANCHNIRTIKQRNYYKY